MTSEAERLAKAVDAAAEVLIRQNQGVVEAYCEAWAAETDVFRHNPAARREIRNDVYVSILDDSVAARVALQNREKAEQLVSGNLLLGLDSRYANWADVSEAAIRNGKVAIVCAAAVKMIDRGLYFPRYPDVERGAYEDNRDAAMKVVIAELATVAERGEPSGTVLTLE